MGSTNPGSPDSSRESQLTRLVKRDGLSEEAANDRLNSQMSTSEKITYADYVLDNSGSMEELRHHVDSLVSTLRSRAGWTWMLAWCVPPVAIGFGAWRLLHRTVSRALEKRAKSVVSSRL